MNKSIVLGIFVGLIAPLCLWADNSIPQSDSQLPIDTLYAESLTNTKSHSKNIVIKKIVNSVHPVNNQFTKKKRERALHKLEKQPLDTTLTSEERISILLKDF